MRAIMDRITESLEQNEQVYEDPLRVRFTDFDNDAILIKVHSENWSRVGWNSRLDCSAVQRNFS